MEIHGSLQSNLEAAILSARRLKGQHVYPDTLAHWVELATYAWREASAKSGPESAILTRLAADLESEISSRKGGTDNP